MSELRPARLRFARPMIVAGLSASLLVLGALPAYAADSDGDGVDDATDCAPLDPTIHPGAVDRPDVGFKDLNCDGIDGDRDKAVFVTLAGNDAASGTLAQPMRTIGAAVAKAATLGKDVYVAGGDYAESVDLADGVGIFGGYAPSGARSSAEVTRITGAPAVRAVGDQRVGLQLLTLRGNPDGAGNSYALRAEPDASGPSSILAESVTASAAAAGAPVSGASGAPGGPGAGFFGGAGGLGGCGNGVLGLLGNPGAGPGGVGGLGANGANNPAALQDAAAWPRTVAAPGAQGGQGTGGRGGQGGTGATGFTAICGGLGGTGGRGGGGGFGGVGGSNGAGSFGAYLFNSTLTAIASTIGGGAGGAGGNGGNGGVGGAASLGLGGLAGECQVVIFVTVCAGNGLPGNPGFAGGPGGGGGAGSGGPSAGVYQAGPQSGFAESGSTVTAGAPGLGGLPGNGGALRAASGPAGAVLRTGTAPAASAADFDGDGVPDARDACVAVPRGANDANGDGCPDAQPGPAPDTALTSGPAEGAIVLSRSATFAFGSNLQGTSFACALDAGAATACTSPLSLSRLASGTHRLTVTARGSTGTPDATPATRSWTVPRGSTELKNGKGWKKKHGTGTYDNAFSQAKKQGSKLTTTVRSASVIALVATKAPKSGVLKVLLGKKLLKKVKLSSKKTRKMQLIGVKSFASPVSGKVSIVVASSGKLVRVEGLAVVTR